MTTHRNTVECREGKAGALRFTDCDVSSEASLSGELPINSDTYNCGQFRMECMVNH